jgi:hypothetical protein
MGTRYHDFEIELDRCCCGEPEIRILESTCNRPRACFELTDAQRDALTAKVEEFEGLLLRGAEHASRRRQLATEVGTELFRTLLPGEIGRTFERCEAALRPSEGLRLRLSFGREYDHRLGGLPWELLCNPETRRFIGAERQTPVVRYLDLPENIKPLDVAPPLKVLGFVAAPDPETSERYCYSEIDAAAHRAILDEAIGSAQYIQRRFVPGKRRGTKATLNALHEELDAAEQAGAPYHVLHFVGHGGFNEDGHGALFFERDDGPEHLVTGAELARQLTEDVRLVVLASCNTGKIPHLRREGRHPFAGVASALLAARIPAVVAMQFTVSEDAVKAFVRPFYLAIDRGQPIDVAVTQGRLSIEALGEEGALEWATPVLFLCSPDGRILNLQTEEVPAKSVAIYNAWHLGRDKLEQVDFEVDLFEYFDRRWIRDRADWNGAVYDELRRTLVEKIPQQSPVHLELAAPLSVAFTTGFLLPVNERRPITVGQRGEPWSFEGDPPAGAPFWLPEDATRELIPADFPFSDDSDEVAVVVQTFGTALEGVAAYLARTDLEPPPPRVGRLVYACLDRPGQEALRSGAQARVLAEEVVNRIERVLLDRPASTIHLFLACPNGLALAIGRLGRRLPRIQLYEFDFEKKRHETYEPSITLVSPRMGETP